MKRWIGRWLLFLVLAQAVSAETWLIESGKGVGPLRFGLGRSEVERVLAPFGPSSEGEKMAVGKQLALRFRQGQLYDITVSTARLQQGGRAIRVELPNGARVGSKDRELDTLGPCLTNTDFYPSFSRIYAGGALTVVLDGRSLAASIEIVDPSWLPGAQVESEVLEARLARVTEADFVQVAGELLHAYERERREPQLRKKISQLLEDSGRWEGLLEGWASYQGKQWDHPLTLLLNVMVEKGTATDRERLETLLARFPESIPAAQLRHLKGERLWLPAAPWVNLAGEAFILDRIGELGHPVASENYLCFACPWGIRVYDLEGALVVKVLLPGKTTRAILVGDSLLACSDEGVFQIALDTWKTRRLGPGSSWMELYQGQVWFVSTGKVFRYDPLGGELKSLEVEAYRVELKEGRLVARGSKLDRVWDEPTESFVPIGPGRDSYGSPYPHASPFRALANGAIYKDGHLELPDGKRVRLETNFRSWHDAAEILADADGVWASLDYDSSCFLDPDQGRTQRFPFRLPLLRGGYTEEATYFVELRIHERLSPGFVRYLKSSGTFRWFSSPPELSPAVVGWSDGPAMTLGDGSRHRFDSGSGAFQAFAGEVREIHSLGRSGGKLAVLGEDATYKIPFRNGFCQSGRLGLVVAGAGAVGLSEIPTLETRQVLDLTGRQRELAREQPVQVDSPESFLRFMKHANPFVRQKAVAALRDGVWFPELLMAARDPDARVRGALVSHLWSVKDLAALPFWEALAESSDPDLQMSAARGMASLGRLPNERLVEACLAQTPSDALCYLIVEQGSERQLEQFLARPRLPEGYDFRERLGARLRPRPDLVDGLFEKGSQWLLRGPVAIEGIRRALRSSDPKVVGNAVELAEQLAEPALAPDLLAATLRWGGYELTEALARCATPEEVEGMVEVYRGGRDQNILRAIVGLAPERGQELFLSMLDSYQYRDFERLVAVEGLAFGPDRKRCVEALRGVAETDGGLDVAARVSLVCLGDADSRRWVKENLPLTIVQLHRLPDKELEPLRADLGKLAMADQSRAMMELADKKPHFFPQAYFEGLAALPEEEPRRVAARHLQSADLLWKLVVAGQSERDEYLELASLVTLTALGDGEARARLALFSEQVRVRYDGDYNWFIWQILRLNDLSFLEDEWKYPDRLVDVDLKLFERFVQRLEKSKITR